MIFKTFREANHYAQSLSTVTRIAIVATGILISGSSLV